MSKNDEENAGDQGEGRERRCIVDHAVKEEGDLVRFVIGPEGEVVPDIAARLPGRGIWVTASRAALETAAKKNLFAKAAKESVKVPKDLVNLVAGLLHRRVLEYLGLTRRAGLIVAGFTKVEAALKDVRAKGRVIALLEAADGAMDGLRKLSAVAARERGDLPVLKVATAEEMGLALGQGLVVHAALFDGGLARKLLSELRRRDGIAAPAQGPH
ncbi:MAG: RNA-binding protein [Alphaproteobacteria bacterium]|nr:RNA-binding protein [Alphaproteobacteria bacterium]